MKLGGNSERKREADIINLPAKERVTDEEFQLFMDALTGPYRGGGYTPE